jgi:ADP-ribose pyrophosphatase YjhB (NUDIX family)
MDIIKTIEDFDIGGEDQRPAEFRERKAARAVVFDHENKIALFHSTVKHYYKLPGGGLNEGEEIEAALHRELLEEIGCEVEDIKEIGIIEEHRNKTGLHQISYCFSARVLGEKGEPHLEEGEIAEGFVTEWLSLDEAIEKLKKGAEADNYNGKFICLRDQTFLEEAVKFLK